MKEDIRKVTGTQTSEGMIPHREHPIYTGLMMPIKLAIPTQGPIAPWNEPFAPLRFAGKLVWALPGGGEYIF